MNFALLGSDAESLALATAAVEAGHSITWACDLAVGDDWEDLGRKKGSGTICAKHPSGRSGKWFLTPFSAVTPFSADEWSALVDLPEIDAVIVGRGNAPPDLRTEQLCQLAKQDTAVLATHPVVPSVLSYFEIDMARGETGAMFRYYHPTAKHPITTQLAHWIQHGHPRVGAVQQIVCQRALAERSRENVLWHFSRDVLWLVRVAGGLDRLGAIGSTAESSAPGDATYAALSVQMTGKLERAVRWSVGPIDDSPGLCLSLVCEQGRLVLEVDDAGRPTRLSLKDSGQSVDLPLEPDDFHAASDAIATWVDALGTSQGGPSEERPADIDDSTWSEALMAMELTDTIEISLRRGRMIDVHQQQLTEHMAFKGMMSATGCGVLLVLPALMLAAGWLAGKLGLPVAPYWPHALLLMLGLFLGIQVLPILLYSKRKAGR